ncbi:MAG: nitroreductase/quinone reductase family protein [Acidimicrobiia bacterium]
MDPVAEALAQGGIADITTIGRKTGRPHRIEVGFHRIDGELYLTGRPGFKRDWVANIRANPEFTLHLKRGAAADVPVRGETEPDPEERARVLYRILTESWGVDPDRARSDMSRWVDAAPFVRFRVIDGS